MSSSMKACEHHVIQISVGPGYCGGGDEGLQVEIVGGGELVAPHILHGPDRGRPHLLGLEICQAGFASLAQPRQLQDLPGPSDVDFMLAERQRVTPSYQPFLVIGKYWEKIFQMSERMKEN